jgi:hypothetical protein
LESCLGTEGLDTHLADHSRIDYEAKRKNCATLLGGLGKHSAVSKPSIHEPLV